AAKTSVVVDVMINSKHHLHAHTTGIYEGIDRTTLLKICKKHDLMVQVLTKPGFNLLKGYPLAKVDKEINSDVENEVLACFFIHQSEAIEYNFFYGFRQLTEIALKALSPGINDPGTAIISIRSLFELYAFRLSNSPKTVLS